MEEPPRPADSTDPTQAAARARERARGLFDRIAPVIRDVSAASEQNPVLRTTRDALVERAGELVQRADDALGRFTAIEGTVVDEGAAPAAAPTPGTPEAAAAEPAAVRAEPATPADARERAPHWTRQRVARMARAAAIEAARPAQPRHLITRTRVGIVAAAALLLALLLRRRGR